MDQIDEFAASLLIVQQAARLFRMAGHKKTGGLESLPVFLCFLLSFIPGRMYLYPFHGPSPSVEHIRIR